MSSVSTTLTVNIYIQDVINEALEGVDTVKVGGIIVPAARFANDQTMVSLSQRGLQRIMDTLQHTSAFDRVSRDVLGLYWSLRQKTRKLS